MLDPAAAWTFHSSTRLTQWYGHARLLADYVIGQWTCVARHSGQLVWQSHFWRPNTICGVDSGVIVATEMRSDGPWTMSFGCYGISLQSGQIVWVSHRCGIAGFILKWLDAVPGFTNELRDSPHHVDSGRVFCESGRILDIQTGKLLTKAAKPSAGDGRPRRIDQAFYQYAQNPAECGFPMGNGVSLRQTATGAANTEHRSPIFLAENASGDRQWSFATAALGRSLRGNYYSYRLAPPYLYFLVHDEPHPTTPSTGTDSTIPQCTRWFLVTLDLQTGQVVQDFPLSEDLFAECRIEDLDAQGLLIGRSDNSWQYFRRIGSAAN